MLSLRALEGALSVWDEVDLHQVREKSMALSELFIQRVASRCAAHGVVPVGPRDARARGSQVSLAHAGSYALMQALIARGVIGDFRAPDLMRFGFTPLYTSYQDVWQAVEVLADILDTGAWKDPRWAVRTAVT